jgi:serine protease Do
MRTALLVLSLVLGLLGPSPRAEAQPAFAIDRTTYAERRTLQAALALTGDYIGFVDGEWGGMSARALDAWAERQGHDGPATMRDVGRLLADYEVRLAREGWAVVFLEELGYSMAFPYAVLTQPAEDAAGFVAPDDSLAMYFSLLGRARRERGSTRSRSSRRRRARSPTRCRAKGSPSPRSTSPEAGGPMSARWRRADGYLTFTFLSERGRNEALSLMTATLGQGRIPDLDIPQGGILAAARATAGGGGAPPSPPVATAPLPDPRPPSGPRGTVSGTAFHVNASTLVTAAHVVEDCARITLEDGTPLGLIARDGLLDLAVLASPRPSQVWLRIDRDAAPRLGQTAHALGYPYRGILEGGLTVTNGNVSSLGDPGNPRRRIMLSAPVQPGNSGGPLLSSLGDVLGVVVSRLDDMAILDATGTIPQNMNFATPSDRLLDFLEANRVTLASGNAPPFDMDDGLPPAIAAAVVPVLCH